MPFDLPLSSYMSVEAKRAFIRSVLNPVPIEMNAGVESSEGIAKFREQTDKYVFAPLVERAQAIHA